MEDFKTITYILTILVIIIWAFYNMAGIKQVIGSLFKNIKRMLIVPVILFSFEGQAQFPVIDVLNAFIEAVENLQHVQEGLQKYNENATERQGVKNQRKIEHQLNKITKMYRTVNDIVQNSDLNNVERLTQITQTLSTDLNDYLNVEGVDQLTAFGMDADLKNLNVDDWFENLDYDIIDKLSTNNTFEENVALLQANYDKKLNIQKFASKFVLQSAIGNFQLADEFELKGMELDRLINGEGIRIHELQELNITLMDAIPDLLSLIPGFTDNCLDFQVWADSLTLLNQDLTDITLEKKDALEREDLEYHEELIFKELLTVAAIEDYQMKVANCSNKNKDIKNKVEENLEIMEGFMNDISEAMENLGLFEAIEEIVMEPDLRINDGERIKLMDQRDQYFEKSKALRTEAAQMIEEANRSSKISSQELKRQAMYRYNNQLTENLK